MEVDEALRLIDARFDASDVKLQVDHRTIFCELLIDTVAAETRRIGSDVAATGRSLDAIFRLIGSASIRLASIDAIVKLQHSNREVLANDWPERLAVLIRDTMADLEKALAKDDRIPF